LPYGLSDEYLTLWFKGIHFTWWAYIFWCCEYPREYPAQVFTLYSRGYESRKQPSVWQAVLTLIQNWRYLQIIADIFNYLQISVI